MAKVRKDGKGFLLRKGESYLRKRKLYCYSYVNSVGKRKYIYANTLVELREKEEQLQKDTLDKLNVYLIAKADLNYVFDRYILTKRELRSSTRTNYKLTYDRYVRNGFGKKKIAEIKYSDVLTYYLGLVEHGLSIGTVRNINTILKPTFELAVRDNIIRSNPAVSVIAELNRTLYKHSKEKFALKFEEQKAFLDFLDQPDFIRWKPIFTVMFGTGCRVGEIIALRWCDIDMDNNCIHINHSIGYHPRSENNYRVKYEMTLPKTEAGIRTIPMLDEVRAALILEKENQEKFGYHSIVELDGYSGFVFCNRFGNLVNPQGLNKEIKHIVNCHNNREEIKAKREGRKPLLIPYFTCHTARHTFCTRLCENETNVKVIQSVMGHKNITTTLDIYAEVSEQKKQDIFKNLNTRNIF